MLQQVHPDTPAAEAGLKDGDLVTRFAGQSVAGPRELQELVERSPLDSRQKVQLLRDGKPMTVDIVMKSLPDDFTFARMRRPRLEMRDGQAADRAAGLRRGRIDERERRPAQLRQFQRRLVSKVDQEGIAYDRGLREGMLIMKVGKKSVSTVEEFQTALEEESPNDGILLFVRAGSSNRFIVLDDQR